jgi:hypothetical protein
MIATMALLRRQGMGNAPPMGSMCLFAKANKMYHPNG